MEIRVKEAVLHILDINASLPVISQSQLDLDEFQVTELIEKHIQKVFEDSASKQGRFTSQSFVPNVLSRLDQSFLESSIEIADTLYNIMKSEPDIPSADLLIAIAELEGRPYLAILKLNYRLGYTHLVDYGDDGTKNRIIVHQAVLPSQTQKVDEGVLINLYDQSCIVIEKKFEINGEKTIYLRCS